MTDGEKVLAFVEKYLRVPASRRGADRRFYAVAA